MTGPAVPLLDLKAQSEPIHDELMAAVERVVRSQQFILGPDVAAMETDIAAYCGAKHCVGVSSGSDALLAGLMALGVGPGDEVVTTPYTFFATAGSIVRLGATPVFVDIDPVTYNMRADLVAAAVTPRTKAVMPVHLYGRCADMTAINAVAARHGLAVVEDACQAIGSEHDGRRAGSIGTMGCFSFFPSKNLGTFGDGGAVTTNDDALADKLRVLRAHGSHVKYYHQTVGGNFRLDTLMAAVIRVKLKYLDQWTAGRQRNAAFYTRGFAERGLVGNFVTPPNVAGDRHVCNQYVIRVRERDELRKALATAGVGSEVYYPLPLHLQECFQNLGHTSGAFPEAEKAAASTLALPIYAELTEAQKTHVLDAIAAHYLADRRSTAA